MLVGSIIELTLFNRIASKSSLHEHYNIATQGCCHRPAGLPKLGTVFRPLGKVVSVPACRRAALASVALPCPADNNDNPPQERDVSIQTALVRA